MCAHRDILEDMLTYCKFWSFHLICWQLEKQRIMPPLIYHAQENITAPKYKVHSEQCYSSVNHELSWPAWRLTRIVTQLIREEKLTKTVWSQTHTIDRASSFSANTVCRLIHYNEALYDSMRCNIKGEVSALCSATFMSGARAPPVNTLCLCILYLCFRILISTT